MLLGGLVATNTEKLVGNRSIRRQMMFVDGSKRKSSARAAMNFPSWDQLRPGFLGKVCDDTFLHG